MRSTLVLVLSCVAACADPSSDPGENDVLAPGVSGRIELGLDVPVHDFKTLELRAFPRFAATTDYELPPEPFDPAYAPAVYLSAIEFPYDYEVGAHWLGATYSQGWRILGWLSTADFTETTASGDWYGLADFELHDCSSYCDRPCYCSLTEDVGFRIEAQIP